MNKRESKAHRKARLLAILDEELGVIHHNASLPLALIDQGEASAWDKATKKRVEDFMEASLEDSIAWAMQCLQDHPLVAKYGKAYQYGRGGATVAPKTWIEGNSSYARPAEDFELSYGRVAAMIADACEWNSLVSDFCSVANIKMIQETARDEIIERIKTERAEYAHLLMM